MDAFKINVLRKYARVSREKTKKKYVDMTFSIHTQASKVTFVVFIITRDLHFSQVFFSREIIQC